MRFPDLRLTVAILASLLILHGCAQNQILLEQDRAKLGTIGVVRAEYTPELGLDAYAVGGGAGGTKGTFRGLGACLEGAGKSNAGLLAVALIPIICPPFMIYGAYDGVQKAVPKEEALSIENLTKRQDETIRFQANLLELVSRHLEDAGYAFTLIEKGGPSAAGERPDYKLLKREGIDTVLEVGLEKVMLKGDGTDPDLSLESSAGCRLVRTEDNHEIHAFFNAKTKSRAQKFEKWVENDAQLLKDELARSFDSLAQRIVYSAFYRSDTMICPDLPFDNATQYRDSLKPDGPFKSFFREQIMLDSLQPTLAWSALPRYPFWENEPDSRPSISRITYELRLWKIDEKNQTLVYERKDLTAPRHQIEVPLEPSTLYAWTVRARYVRNGQTRISNWSCSPEGRFNYYHFKTPERDKTM